MDRLAISHKLVSRICNVIFYLIIRRIKMLFVQHFSRNEHKVLCYTETQHKNTVTDIETIEKYNYTYKKIQ